MVNVMNDFIIKHQSLKTEFSDITNKYDLDLGRAFSERLWKCLKLSTKLLVPRIIYNVFFDQYSVTNTIIKKDKNAVIWIEDQKKPRADHLAIFSNVKKFIKSYDYLEIKKIKKINVLKMFYRIKITCNLYRKMHKNQEILKIIDNKIKLFYVASLICIVDEVYNLINDEQWLNKKNALIFQDIDIASNTIVQMLQKNNCKVTEVQHGQWLYRNEPYDDFLNINNFSSDYFLAWNEFSKKQFLLAGYDENRIKVVGCSKMLEDSKQTEIRDTCKKFGVVLDTPVYTYANKYNKVLIKMAEKISEKFNYKYYIKLHPFDEKEKYIDIISDEFCAGFMDKQSSMNDYEKLVDFSLAHTTSAAVDLMIMGSIVFLLKTEIYYPLETDKFYEFSDYNSLFEKIELLYKNWNEKKKNYQSVKNTYYEDGAFDKHKKVMDEIFNEK